jgi:hypothetical protein
MEGCLFSFSLRPSSFLIILQHIVKCEIVVTLSIFQPLLSIPPGVEVKEDSPVLKLSDSCHVDSEFLTFPSKFGLLALVALLTIVFLLLSAPPKKISDAK